MVGVPEDVVCICVLHHTQMHTTYKTHHTHVLADTPHTHMLTGT